MKLTKDVIKAKITNALEEESRPVLDALEQYVDDIADELLSLDVTEESFLDYLQNEIEKYDEYLAIED